MTKKIIIKMITGIDDNDVIAEIIRIFKTQKAADAYVVSQGLDPKVIIDMNK